MKPPCLTTTQHNRQFYGTNQLVYPVLSRRIGGLSIGINTSPSKTCSFKCIYCEVDRSIRETVKFDLDLVDAQLKKVLTSARNGYLNNQPIKAITLSGDGEPTLLANFKNVVQRLITIRDSFDLVDTKLVVISNATGLNKKTVKEGLGLMDLHNGELWAKLDAGTEEYFKRITRTDFSFDKILSNILSTSRKHPVKIQTCFMNLASNPPSLKEILAYSDRINQIIAGGGQIKAIQLYTISRLPAESYVTALTNDQMNQIVEKLRKSILIPIEVYL